MYILLHVNSMSLLYDVFSIYVAYICGQTDRPITLFHHIMSAIIQIVRY